MILVSGSQPASDISHKPKQGKALITSC